MGSFVYIHSQTGQVQMLLHATVCNDEPKQIIFPSDASLHLLCCCFSVGNLCVKGRESKTELESQRLSSQGKCEQNTICLCSSDKAE